MHANHCDLFQLACPDSCGAGEGTPDADLFPVPPAGYFLILVALAFLPRYAHAEAHDATAWEPHHYVQASIDGPARAVGLVTAVQSDEITVEGVELRFTGNEYIQILSGPASGRTLRILDVTGNRIRVAKAMAHLLGEGDSFAIRNYPEIRVLYG